MEEIWKDIKGYEGRYKVSNLGNVYSMFVKRNIKTFEKRDGGNVVHVCVSLNKDDKAKEKQVKRLVAEAFIGDIEGKVVVCKDGNSYNLKADNLEIITQKQCNERANSIQDKENYVRYLNKYKVVYRPDHFNHTLGKDYEGWVYEHRYVVEHNLGRALDHDEVVHHKDGDIYNNDISNLEVLNRSDHMKLHMRERGYKERFCVDCGKRIYNSATRCLDCHYKKLKSHKPDKYKLYEEVKASTYTAVAKKYGVSNTTIENWLEDLYKPKKHRKKSL